MFIGIITRVGRIERHQPLGSGADHGLRLHVAAGGDYLADVALGDSIAINGACMTVTSLDPAQGVFTVDVSAESLARTMGLDRPGPVNLEKATRPADWLGGHIVSGHVDGVGTVTRLAAVGESWNPCVLARPPRAKYLGLQGVDHRQRGQPDGQPRRGPGDGREVGINLILHTMQHTAMGTLMVGARVNLEVDMIARYVERIFRVSLASC